MICAFFLALSVLACVQNQPDVIVITATFLPNDGEPRPPVALTQAPDPVQPPLGTLINPTANPTRALPGIEAAGEYVVQPGDTLSGIALRNGVSVETLLAINDLPNPDQLEVGQVIRLPAPPSEYGSSLKILPDSRLVRAPGSASFDVQSFINQQPGFVRIATDIVNGEFFTAAQLVERVALEYSVDARVLLALLEYKSRFLTNPDPDENVRIYPLGAPASPLGFDRNGLYRQLTWAADQLNVGYYGWKLRGLSIVEFSDGARVLYAPDLNAGTVAVQHLLSLHNDYFTWQQQVSSDGFFRTFVALFGDPFANTIDPLVPPSLEQPLLTFPFPRGETWYYTGGPHGAWGSGSAWSAIDFAPPDDIATVTTSCYVSDFFATALAPGVIARTDEGTVILDLDGDGDETTGWTILYLHMAERDRIQPGTIVQVGDRIGRPSCEGGFSTGTHMHLARRYNGEWIPASCDRCAESRPPFVLDGWTVVGLTNQEYQGFLVKGNDRRVAEQGRNSPENHVSW